ncbi:MAG: hypothetical protein DCF25_14700 [Leptolyngbya foveolarum]|uniref:EamA domain-containing protein n=1 Tax=Leptolyngbya foveolarum TaxID=47253 RepID=A0A2W4VQW6_9CYAN|nr:MAG: hypothetical protein DCF25_14700 [Leptolyngbya foveolarum]
MAKNIWVQSLLAVLTSLLFAGSFVAGKYTTSEMSPLMITLLRYAIASLFLHCLVWVQAKKGSYFVSRSIWLLKKNVSIAYPV